MTNNWQIEKYSAAFVLQIPGGVTDKHWSMIKNLRHLCCRFLVVWLTSIDLWSKICGIRAADSWWCDWQTLIYDRKSAARMPQIPGGVTDKHWSMIENLRHSCRRFLVVLLTNIDLWSKICGTNAADSWWCDWQTLIYDRKSAAFVPQIPGGVTDKHWSIIKNLRHSCRRFLVVWLTDVERQTDSVTPPFSVPK
jgi:sulfur relay (sulfurtransferase) DsrC/TusE family protein